MKPIISPIYDLGKVFFTMPNRRLQVKTQVIHVKYMIWLVIITMLVLPLFYICIYSYGHCSCVVFTLYEYKSWTDNRIHLQSCLRTWCWQTTQIARDRYPLFLDQIWGKLSHLSMTFRRFNNRRFESIFSTTPNQNLPKNTLRICVKRMWLIMFNARLQNWHKWEGLTAAGHTETSITHLWLYWQDFYSWTPFLPPTT